MSNQYGPSLKRTGLDQVVSLVGGMVCGLWYVVVRCAVLGVWRGVWRVVCVVCCVMC